MFFAFGCGGEQPQPKKDEKIEVPKDKEDDVKKEDLEKKDEPEPKKEEPKKIGDFTAKDVPEEVAKGYETNLEKTADALQKIFTDSAAKNKNLKPVKVMFTLTVDKTGKVKVTKTDCKDKALDGALKKELEGLKDLPKAQDKPVEITFSIELGKAAGEPGEPGEPKDEPEPKKGEPKKAEPKKVEPKKK